MVCHGFCHPEDPQKSGVLLGGSSKLEEMMIRDLGNTRNGIPQLAYLSTCSIAEVRLGQLVDESVHLANMFQLIGYRHVIATMQEAYDSAAVEMGKSFCRELFVPKGSGFLDVAEALDNAMLTVREQDSKDMMRLASFVHLST